MGRWVRIHFDFLGRLSDLPAALTMTRFELQVTLGLYLIAACSRFCFGFVPCYRHPQKSRRWQELVINKLQSFASESPSNYTVASDTVSSSPHAAATTKPQQFLVHKGRSAAMIRRSPSLCGVTLCKGWSEQATQAFCDAVHSVVRNNPILTGHVYDSKNKRELWIESGTFSPETHNFVRVVDAPPTVPDFDRLDPAELVQTLSKDFIPLFDGSELSSEQIKHNLPLLAANLMILPDGYAMFSLKMSHCVGDGVTFFELVKQVSLYMNGLEVPPIQWDNPKKATHEFYPPYFTDREIDISYGAPFMLGALKNFLTSHRSPSVFLLDKNKINAKKRQLRDETESRDISSNDVITAGVCEAVGSSDIFIFTESVRGVVDGVPLNAGGNFHWEIPVPRDVIARPDLLRKVVKAGGYKDEELPLQPFLCGRVGRITSLASITEGVGYEGMEMICSVPSLSFMKDIPLDVAVIFRFNRQFWGVLHNSAEFKVSGLLEDALVDASPSNQSLRMS